MDEKLLIEQYGQTGNVLDVCSTAAWMESIAGAGDGPIEAGLPMQGYANQLQALTSEQMQHIRHQMHVQSLLLPVLHDWMRTWDLGAGFQDTYTIARRLVRQHLAAPTPALQQLLDRLLASEFQPDHDNPVDGQQIIELLSATFSADDWQEMAQAASQSISAQVLKTGQSPSKPAAA